MQSAMSDGAAAVPAGTPDCDAMAPTSSEDGKSKVSICKVTAQCQMGSLYHPVSSPSVVRPSGLFVAVSFQHDEGFSVRDPDGPWRPPRYL